MLRVLMSRRHSGDSGRRTGGRFDPERSVAGDVLLARTTTGPLARNHGATFEDLATPDTPRLLPFERSREAGNPDGAVTAEGLREFELGRSLGEPEVRVEVAARESGLDRHFSTRLGDAERGHDQVHYRSPRFLLCGSWMVGGAR